MKQVALIRDRIIRHMHELRLQISNLPEFETQAITALGGIPYTDADELAKTVEVLMVRLGAVPCTDSRFSQSVRAVQKDTPTRGRGVLTLEDRQLLNGCK